jgi:hypothetical protein
MRKAIAALGLALTALAAAEFSPDTQPADGVHYYLLDGSGIPERAISREDWCHGDRFLVVTIEGGEICEAYTCWMSAEIPNTMTMREFSPLTPEQAAGMIP